MRYFSDLLRALMGNRDAVMPSLQTFPRLDVEQVVADMRLLKRAEKSGSLNQPDQASDIEDAAERDIAAEIERRANNGREEFRKQLDIYEGRIQRAMISGQLKASVIAAGEKALSDFRIQAVKDL